MKSLIEITTVPIQIEMKTTNAKLEYARGTAEMEITRDKGGLSIKSRPIRVNIDTFEARNSVTPTLARSLQQNAQKGQQAAYQATATYAKQGKLMMETKLGEEMIIRYEMDKLNFDWKFGKGDFEFTPGDIEFTVTQRPEVVIKYVGGPIYVPPSADPNYEPVDVKG